MISFEALRRGSAFLMCLLLGNVLFAADTDDEEWRTWSSSEGAEIEAYLKEVVPEGVVIVRRDGREFTAPLERFSEADRAYVAKWQQEQLPSAEKFRELDFTQVDVPERHEISGVAHVEASGREPPEAAAVKMVLDFHNIDYGEGLSERIEVRQGDTTQLIPPRDLANALQNLPVETEVIRPEINPIDREPGDAENSLNAIKAAVSRDLPVIVGHRPYIEVDTPEFAVVAIGYDNRNLRMLDPSGSRQAARLDLRDLDETLLYAMVIFPTFEAVATDSPQEESAPPSREFLSRVSTAIREVPEFDPAALVALLQEKDIDASLRDVNRSDFQDQLGRTRSFAREGGIPQIKDAISSGSVAVIPQEYDGDTGFALIYEQGESDFAAVEFLPDGTFRRGRVSVGDLASRWLTREDRTYRLDLIQITPPAAPDESSREEAPPRSAPDESSSPETPPPPPREDPPSSPPPPPARDY